MNRTLITALIVIIVAGAGAYLLLRDGTNGMNGEDMATTTTDTSTTTGGGPSTGMLMQNAVVIQGGIPGKSVTVPIVNTKDPGFIAIHRDDNGKPGKVIGNSALLQSGVNENVAITLSESVKIGDHLFAMLHVDADHDGKYTFPGADVPVTTEDGMIVMAGFSIGTSTPTTTINNF